MELVLENPFSSNNVSLGRAGDEVPSVVVLKSCIFIFHGLAPMRISKSITIGPR